MTDGPSQRAVTTDDFWAHLKKINAGLLGTTEARHVPMSHQADMKSHALWFITAKGTDLAKSVAGGSKPASYMLGGEDNLYARVEGQLSLVDDQAALDQLWNVVADSWFEGGSRDPDAVALRLDVGEAEVWETPGSLGTMFEIAKSRVTGRTPDIGRHGMLRF